jgi:FkbM family methyltransferase
MTATTLIKAAVGFLPPAYQHRIRKSYHRYRLRGERAPVEFDVIRPLVADAEWVVDAGANVGLYTAFLARLSRPGCRVLSIEPIECTFDILRSNITSLGLKNVQAVRCALSDASRTVLMEVPEDGDGRPVYYLARIKFSDAGKRPSSSYDIDARTLDDLVGEKPVAFIKYDVEMHELESIRGSLRVIDRDRPAIYVEIQPDLRYKKSQRDEIVALLRPRGYEPFVYDAGVLRSPGAGAFEFFFLTTAHLQSLADAGVPAIKEQAVLA